MVIRRFLLATCAVLGVLMVSLLSSAIHHAQNQVAQKSKVYECLKLEGSIEDLSKHLDRHSSLVDVFVILEKASEGSEQLLFKQHLNKFSDYRDKIIYLSSTTDNESDHSEFLGALNLCRDQDVVLFTSLKQLMECKDLKEGVKWLHNHPDKWVQFKGGDSTRTSFTSEPRAAKYGFLKKCRLDDLNKSLDSHVVSNHKLFFQI